MKTGDMIGTDRGEQIIDTGLCPTATCGLHVYVPREQYEQLLETGTQFWCPAGHGQAFPARPKRDAEAKRLREAEAAAAKMQDRADRAARTCPWPTCDGRLLASPQGLRQHMVKSHGAPWASPELSVEEIGQVLNGRDPAELSLKT